MNYCRYQTAEGARYASVEMRADGAWAVAPMFPPEEDLAALRLHSEQPLENFAATSLAQMEGERLLLAPCVPSKIVCVGRNYREHAAELGNDVPTEPLIFLKPPSSLLAPGATVQMPAASKRIDFEGELALVIGRRATKLASDEEAWAAVRGYTCLNDVTARDLQKSDAQWTRGKGFDTFCPVGPFVVDAAELDATALALTTRVNGVVKQSGNTGDFIFDIPTVLRYITSFMTLEAGDVVATGTPAGVAAVSAGDVVEVEIAGLGILRNPFAAA